MSAKQFIILAALAGGAYYYMQKQKQTQIAEELPVGARRVAPGLVQLRDGSDMITLTPSTSYNPAGQQYDLPIDIIKRGGPTTTSSPTIIRPPPRFEIPMVQDERPSREPVLY